MAFSLVLEAEIFLSMHDRFLPKWELLSQIHQHSPQASLIYPSIALANCTELWEREFRPCGATSKLDREIIEASEVGTRGFRQKSNQLYASSVEDCTRPQLQNGHDCNLFLHQWMRTSTRMWKRWRRRRSQDFHIGNQKGRSEVLELTIPPSHHFCANQRGRDD